MEITHNETKHKFVLSEGQNKAEIEYEPFEGGINILHTFVPKLLQNKGHGAALVKRVLDYARKKHFKVIATCPFARVYITRHKQYEDLL